MTDAATITPMTTLGRPDLVDGAEAALFALLSDAVEKMVAVERGGTDVLTLGGGEEITEAWAVEWVDEVVDVDVGVRREGVVVLVGSTGITGVLEGILAVVEVVLLVVDVGSGSSPPKISESSD